MGKRLTVGVVACVLMLGAGCGAAATQRGGLTPVAVDPIGLGNVHVREVPEPRQAASHTDFHQNSSSQWSGGPACDSRYCDPR